MSDETNPELAIIIAFIVLIFMIMISRDRAMDRSWTFEDFFQA